MVLSIDQCDADLGTGQRASGVQPGESAADDDDVRSAWHVGHS